MDMAKYMWFVYLLLVVYVFYSFDMGFAVVDKSSQWLPVQQIAISPSSTTSIDNNMNGMVDNCEKLNGYSSSDFIKSSGGVLKGPLFLYYGTGRIVDLDNPSYFIDPSWEINVNSLCIKGKCISNMDDFVKQGSNATLSNLLSSSISSTQLCLSGSCISSWKEVNISLDEKAFVKQMGNATLNNISSLQLNSNLLCLNDKCISSWEEVNTTNINVSLEDINNNGLIDLVDKSNVSNDSLSLVGVKKEDIINSINVVHQINTSCISGDCSKINASLLQGYGVANNGDANQGIVVINPSITYTKLKVGFASYSLHSNSTDYIGSLSSDEINKRINYRCPNGEFVNSIEDNRVVCSSPSLPQNYNTLVSQDEMKNYVSEYVENRINKLKQNWYTQLYNQLNQRISSEAYSNVDNNFATLLYNHVGTCPSGEYLAGFNSYGPVCKKLPNNNEMDVEYDDDYGESIIPYDANVNGHKDSTCPEGYVMVGLQLDKRSVCKNLGCDKTGVVENINIICRKLKATPYAHTP